MSHGMYGTRTYESWAKMKQRCLNPKTDHYADYGGRGITVCDKWHTFEGFFEDMGVRPEGMSLDRWPEVNGNYCKDNCRWATQEQQVRNQRTSVITEEKVRWLRALLTAKSPSVTNAEFYRRVAPTFGCSVATVKSILQGRNWSTVK